MAVKTWTSERVTSADINTYLTNSGLVYVTGASFSAAASVSVSNCFTSTYSNYRIVFDVDSANSLATRTIRLRWRTAGGDDNTAIYDYGSQGIGIGSTTFDSINSGYGQTEIIIVNFYAYTSQASGFIWDVISPQVSTKKTKHSGTIYGGTASADVSGFASGFTQSNTTHTGFSVYPSTGTITGSYNVYGYRNA